MSTHPTAIVLLLCLTILGSGCDEDDPATRRQAPASRPVTVIRLAETDPTRGLRLTGSIQSWTEQDISFDVSGFVDWIVESGTDLNGRWVNEEGGVVVRGDALARLDSSRFTLRCQSIEAAIEVAKQELHAAELAAERVIPANLAAAEANLKRANEEFRRVKLARDNDAVSELELIRRAADRSESLAKTEQIKALLEAKRAEVGAARARVSELERNLAAARLDVERCTLFAPFSGQVSKVNTQAGGYAAVATPVAHLVMMDPLKVILAVSSTTANRLLLGDPVRVYLPDESEPVMGEVYDKETVADAATRTMRVSVLIRNERVAGKLPRDSELLARPRAREIFQLERKRAGNDRDPWMIEERTCLHRDDDGWFVWAVANLKAGERLNPDRPVLRLEKVAVTPGEQRVNFQGLYLFREIADAKGLDRSSLIAGGVPATLKDEKEVVYAPERWRLSPGQTVNVLLPGNTPSPGLWVPMSALTPESETTGVVFIVDGGVARRVTVRLTGTVGSLWRIEAAQPGERGLIAPGTQVISKDVHFLVAGEPVKVINVKEVKP